MKILFIHQNFPGQYKHLAPLLAHKGHDCVALTLRVEKPVTWKNVRVLPYALPKRSGQNVHPWLIDLDTKVTRAEACYHAAMRLKEAGFIPDLILAHPGWGESMFLRDVWPEARMGLYCELYHHADYPHLNFDPEFEKSNIEIEALRIRMKNLNNHIHFPVADAGISPTKFQADTFPAEFRDKITISHDGIDTIHAAPAPDVRLTIEGQVDVTREDEVITFVNRNLEPYRGYHIFMRALPRLLKERPKARVLIVGGDEVSYGARPPDGQTWKQIFIDEVRGQISDADWTRVHFLGRIPYDQFLRLLQVSRVHVYLTYPFVLSWSLMEAMGCEAAIVASDTAPVREAITDNETGLLVDFFDTDALVGRVCALLEDRATRKRLGQAARKLMREHYDLRTICLPRQMNWVNGLLDGNGVQA
ncbi:GDP-mannose-dependent alpha-(1-2)-phosphatidylinositol mannosyltransferase [Roseovarius litorisediminis]|uniref:GDP-mannose-dependent alpha-(1-2)-phosphatidylinositol mannosyltransferase n=1 Tax=Roseovarius litorisediminis TaxID=1312363 RepID=A0A1Y5TPS7_9RHOB|nr:glycosyltransferase [Roseovarius litorisediminis]SLN69093.1 GDP-mannose-dependent alpha-(1-2)-phosphatidylinositol mannosyltransferase [Roseovarius litorisediminis]